MTKGKIQIQTFLGSLKLHLIKGTKKHRILFLLALCRSQSRKIIETLGIAQTEKERDLFW